jgi:hypothetical protein
MDTLKKRVWHGIRQITTTRDETVFKPIDIGIAPTVKALNELGVPTTFSCYGHMASGDDGPYVEVESPAALELQTQLCLGELYPFSEEYELIHDRIEKLNLVEHKRLLSFVSAFYRHRESLSSIRSVFRTRDFQEEDRLVVNSRFDKSRLESRGAVLLRLVGSNGIRAKKLKKYRREINAFTAFLEMGLLPPQIKRP